MKLKVSEWKLSVGTVMACAQLWSGCVAAAPDAAGYELSPDSYDDDEALDKALGSGNGLNRINGLSRFNGMISLNGLTSDNGLTVVNGIRRINGLATLKGQPIIDGQKVNCAGLKSGQQCTGRPDGLLSNTTGLMRDDQGVATARYLVQCALPANRRIVVAGPSGRRVALRGALGLAPAWETGACDSECQEKVTACLLAHLNGSGAHVPIVLSAAWAYGQFYEPPAEEMFQEAVFFGNIFTEPPEAYVAVHRDWAEGIRDREGERLPPVPRMCSGVSGIDATNFPERYRECPVEIIGSATPITLPPMPGIGDYVNACHMDTTHDGAAASECRLPGESRKWQWPITTFLYLPSSTPNTGVISLNRATLPVNAPIEVKYSTLPVGQDHWVGLYSAGADDEDYLTFHYLDGTQGSVSFSSLPVGNYEARLYYNDSYHQASSRTFRVK